VSAAELEPLHRYTSAEYHQLIEAGAFQQARVELIDGLLVEMSPKSREHERALEALHRWLVGWLDLAQYRLRVQMALSLADGTEPEPDLAVVPADAPDPYHPATAALIIEVAANSQHRDLIVKSARYAAAGVPVYVVVDLDARRVIDHTDPTPDGYRTVRQVNQLEARLPGASVLDAADLFAAAFA
jgi:Uma2 family endonuclease